MPVGIIYNNILYFNLKYDIWVICTSMLATKVGKYIIQMFNASKYISK